MIANTVQELSSELERTDMVEVNEEVESVEFKRHRQRRRKPKKGNTCSNTDGKSFPGDVEMEIPAVVAGPNSVMPGSEKLTEMIAFLGLTLCDPASEGPSSIPGVLEQLPATEKVKDISCPSQPSKSSKEKSDTDNKKSKKKRKKSVKEIASSTVPAETEADKTINASSPTTPQHKKNQAKNKAKSPGKENIRFEPHWPASEVERGLAAGQLVKGLIRINQKNYKEAYINSPDSNGQDILIDGVGDRNRALEGDLVVVLIKESEEEESSESSSKQRTGKVVAIEEHNHSRTCVGFLRPMTDGNAAVALFSPRDSRIPRMRIPMYQCPKDFLKQSEDFKNTLYAARIIIWEQVAFGIGELQENLGQCGDIRAETAALLQENDLDISPYPDSMLQFLPSNPCEVRQEVYEDREDLRKLCIFTVDPATAQDLDDAISCRELNNGNLEVGVHIADVAYFLKEGTPLDQAVSKRATSVYLVDTVHHMLPKAMCLMLSLLPGEDKPTFSVIWEITRDGKIVSHRFTRSVINSCTKLAYENAQAMLENPNKEWTREELPEIFGGHLPSEISRNVCLLNELAIKMRLERFKAGSLRIDQTKIMFCLDHEAGMPTKYIVYINMESHRMIEELMLLANRTVAKQLHTEFPDIAFLRCHPPPKDFLMAQLQRSLEEIGIHLDVTDAGKLQSSLARYAGNDHISQTRMMVLHTLVARPMARAKYFCLGKYPFEQDQWHYALSTAFYTHFTSPIRRYADVMVHRLLAASLQYQEKPSWTPDYVQKVATHCNKQKYAAKLAGEQSIKFYLTVYIGIHQPMLEEAVVVDVKDHSFDVLVCNLGLTQRIYTNNLAAEINHELKNKISTLYIKWKPTKENNYTTLQVIEIFSQVVVELRRSEAAVKIDATLVRPAGPGAHLSS